MNSNQVTYEDLLKSKIYTIEELNQIGDEADLGINNLFSNGSNQSSASEVREQAADYGSVNTTFALGHVGASPEEFFPERVDGGTVNYSNSFTDPTSSSGYSSIPVSKIVDNLEVNDSSNTLARATPGGASTSNSGNNARGGNITANSNNNNNQNINNAGDTNVTEIENINLGDLVENITNNINTIDIDVVFNIMQDIDIHKTIYELTNKNSLSYDLDLELDPDLSNINSIVDDGVFGDLTLNMNEFDFSYSIEEVKDPLIDFIERNAVELDRLPNIEMGDTSESADSLVESVSPNNFSNMSGEVKLTDSLEYQSSNHLYDNGMFGESFDNMLVDNKDYVLLNEEGIDYTVNSDLAGEGSEINNEEVVIETVDNVEDTGNAVAPEVVEAVAPEVVEAVAPEVVEAVASEAVEAVAPEAVEAVAPEVVEAVAPEVVEAVASEAVEAVAPEAVEAVAPEVVEAVAPEVVEAEVPEVVIEPASNNSEQDAVEQTNSSDPNELLTIDLGGNDNENPDAMMNNDEPESNNEPQSNNNNNESEAQSEDADNPMLDALYDTLAVLNQNDTNDQINEITENNNTVANESPIDDVVDDQVNQNDFIGFL